MACIWYIEAKDAQTNRVIAGELSSTSACEDINCADGIKRNLWECNWHFVARLENSRAQLQLKFAVFNQEGKTGPIREWKFPKKPAPKVLKGSDARIMRHNKGATASIGTGIGANANTNVVAGACQNQLNLD